MNEKEKNLKKKIYQKIILKKQKNKRNTCHYLKIYLKGELERSMIKNVTTKKEGKERQKKKQTYVREEVRRTFIETEKEKKRKNKIDEGSEVGV